MSSQNLFKNYRTNKLSFAKNGVTKDRIKRIVMINEDFINSKINNTRDKSLCIQFVGRIKNRNQVLLILLFYSENAQYTFFFDTITQYSNNYSNKNSVSNRRSFLKSFSFPVYCICSLNFSKQTICKQHNKAVQQYFIIV